MAAQLFAIAVTIIIAGVIWFHVVRPILEDFGIIRPMESVSSSGDDDTSVMSREQESTPIRAPSALETDGRQTADRPMMAVPTPEQMLDIFKVMRAAGIKRDAISGAWRAAGLPLNNNLWAKAEPPSPDDPPAITPIAGRPTSAQFADPELSYQPPPR